MSRHVISGLLGESLSGVNFAPATVAEEVLQNILTIVATVKGTVPLDRDFGLDGSVIDKPVNLAQARLTADIVEKVRKYEPRATIRKVTYAGDTTGLLRPVLEVEIND